MSKKREKQEKQEKQDTAAKQKTKPEETPSDETLEKTSDPEPVQDSVPPPVPVIVPAPVASSGGVSVPTLLVLLILTSVLSSALSPLFQHGLRRAAELYLGLSPDQLAQLQGQQQAVVGQHVVPAVQSPVLQPAQAESAKLQPRSIAPLDESTYVCKHSYRLRIVHRDPMIMIADDFLQPGEAEHMIAIAKPKMERSRVFGKTYSEARTSSSAYLKKSSDAVVRCIEERASLLTNISVADTESLQVVWYTKGQEFRPHFDYVSHEDLKRDYWTRFGQRYVTMLVYLNEPEEGGNTDFPELGLSFAPKRNAAVIWYNVGLDEKEDPRTLHGGAPVIRGEKYAINIWQRKMIPHVEEILREKEAQEAINKADPSKPVDYAPVSETPKKQKVKDEL